MKRFCAEWLWVAGLALVTSGCTSTHVTNLTPAEQPRSSKGLYVFEAAWSSNQKSIRKESVSPSVVIGSEAYPMRPVPVVKNRWEALVPVPASESLVNYRFKFDFEYLSVPIVRANSKMSAPYQLRIVEK